MEWVSIKDRLPEFKTRVLVWVLWGHRLQYQIASLYDHNGVNGYTEWVGLGGRIIQKPNEEYPLNLVWNIDGHWVPFDRCSYWMSLPSEPNAQ